MTANLEARDWDAACDMIDALHPGCYITGEEHVMPYYADRVSEYHFQVYSDESSTEPEYSYVVYQEAMEPASGGYDHDLGVPVSSEAAEERQSCLRD